jgi:hypothetical protein
MNQKSGQFIQSIPGQTLFQQFGTHLHILLFQEMNWDVS